MDEQRGLDAWAQIEANHADRVQALSAMMLAQRFSERARRDALRAEEALLAAQRRAERARDYLERTSNTLEQTTRLVAMVSP